MDKEKNYNLEYAEKEAKKAKELKRLEELKIATDAMASTTQEQSRSVRKMNRKMLVASRANIEKVKKNINKDDEDWLVNLSTPNDKIN